MDQGFQKRAPQSFLAQRIDEKNRMKDSVAGHRTGLTDRLLKLFAPRNPLQAVPTPPPKPKALPLSGIADYVQHFASPGDPEYQPGGATAEQEPRLFRSPELQYQARIEAETLPEREIRLAEEAKAKAEAAVAEVQPSWDVTKDPSIQGDPFRTLFVGRLSYEASERKLRRELEEYGPIRRIRIVHDKNSGKPRGYAFVEFESKNDMKQAYKMADGKKVEDRRILVDVERGRAVAGWKPRRLGGGKGGESRMPRPPKDPRRLMVRRMIQRYQEEREKLAAEAAGPPPETQDAPPREADAARSRSRDAGRSPSHDRARDRSRELRRRSRSPPRGRRSDRASPLPALARERSEDLERRDSDREAGELPERDEDDRSRGEYGFNGRDSRGRHMDRKRERDRSYDRSPKRTREREREGVYA